MTRDTSDSAARPVFDVMHKGEAVKVLLMLSTRLRPLIVLCGLLPVVGGLNGACNDSPAVSAPSAATGAPGLPTPPTSRVLTGAVFGNVGQERRPISAARVYVTDLLEGPYGNYPWFEARTDPDGRFSIALPGLNNRTVRVSAHVEPALAQLCAVHRTMDRDTTADIELAEPGVLSSTACGTPILFGVVFEDTPDGRRPVANVPVSYFSRGPHDSMDVYTQTDAAGRYSFGDLPFGLGWLAAGCYKDRLQSSQNSLGIDVTGDTRVDIPLSISSCIY